MNKLVGVERGECDDMSQDIKKLNKQLVSVNQNTINSLKTLSRDIIRWLIT